MDARTLDALIAAAIEAHATAYAPYSRFQVGAALLGQSGRIYKGCNVENVSYGLTSCAERNAIFRGVGDGEHRFSAVAVVTAADTLTPPCGACRQVLMEFAVDHDMDVILAGLHGNQRLTTLSTLLPDGFITFHPTQA